MVSCSNDETLDVVAKTPITFGKAFVEKSTRAATDNTYGGGTSELEKFNIYGTVTGNNNTVNIYSGDEVTGTVGANTWNCTKTQYWVEDCDYSFIALVDAEVKEDKDENGMPTKFTYDVTSQKDILLATTDIKSTDTDKFGQPINFTFDHLLAKAKFTFTNGFSEDSGVELTVTDIKIIDAPQYGTYTIGENSSWTISDTKDNDYDGVSFGTTDKIQPIKTGESGLVSLLIPGTYENGLTITFTITHELGGEPTEKTMSTGNITLVPGCYYNFTAELNSGNVEGVVPIEFNIIKSDTWEEDTDKEIQY